MRLKSIHLQNYRTHRDFAADFSDGITLIQGPNESGKSTLVEAIHRVLFLKAKGLTESHKAMKSNHGGNPVVQLVFEAEGKTHTLIKQFSGNSGTVTLATSGQSSLTGDPAEEKLAQLLKVDGAVGGGGAGAILPHRWAHLWIWQGASHLSPLESLSESNSALSARLLAEAGQNLSISATDNRLIEQLRLWQDANFTSAGKPKAGSSLKAAEDRLAAASDKLQELDRQLNSLLEASTKFSQATSDILRNEESIQRARNEMNTVTSRLKEVEACQQSLKDKRQLLAQAAATLASLQASDTEIRALEADIAAREQQAAPLQQRLASAAQDLEFTRQKLTVASGARESQAQAALLARASATALRAHADWLKAQAEKQRFEQRSQQLTELRRQQEATSELTVHLEAFTAANLKALRDKHNALNAARARLEAYALRVKVLTSDLEVRIGERLLSPEQIETVTAECELQIGSGTRLQLIPGGSSDIASARSTCAQAETAYHSELAGLGVKTPDQAEHKASELQQAKSALKAIESQIHSLQPEELETDLKRCREDIARQASQRDKAVEGLTLTFATDISSAEQALFAAEPSRQQAEDEEKGTVSVANALNKKLKQFEEAHSAALQAVNTQSHELQSLRGRLQLMLERSGEVTLRSESIHKAQANRDQAAAAVKLEEDHIHKLAPEELQSDKERLTQTITNCERLLQSAREQKASAQALLQSSGTTDPERLAKEAAAEVEQAKLSLASLHSQANARKRLLTMLTDAQRQITTALTLPLEQATAPYLSRLFGQGAQARLTWAEDGTGLTGLSIDRGHQQLGCYSFSQLSQGTREQVSLALRLATAKILCANHDGCLPLIMDDAFTHADSSRISALRILLYEAVKNGLQIILCTCHLENYTGLTTTEINLPGAR